MTSMTTSTTSTMWMICRAVPLLIFIVIATPLPISVRSMVMVLFSTAIRSAIFVSFPTFVSFSVRTMFVTAFATQTSLWIGFWRIYFLFVLLAILFSLQWVWLDCWFNSSFFAFTPTMPPNLWYLLMLWHRHILQFLFNTNVYFANLLNYWLLADNLDF